MTREIVIASRNKGKIAEILQIFAGMPFKFTTLADYPAISAIEETGATFAENARLKAFAVARLSGQWALSDDSGLEVDALGGRPGVHSARYSGDHATDESNNALLLKELAKVPPEKCTARYRAVIVLADPAGKVLAEAEGHCEGQIGRDARGSAGFGYDPLFILPELGQTMAELGLEYKNRISHRAMALEALRERMKDLPLSV